MFDDYPSLVLDFSTKLYKLSSLSLIIMAPAPDPSCASLLTGDWPGVDTMVSVFSPIIGKNCSLMSPATRIIYTSSKNIKLAAP